MREATDQNIGRWSAEYGIQGGEAGIKNARVSRRIKCQESTRNIKSEKNPVVLESMRFLLTKTILAKMWNGKEVLCWVTNNKLGMKKTLIDDSYQSWIKRKVWRNVSDLVSPNLGILVGGCLWPQIDYLSVTL